MVDILKIKNNNIRVCIKFLVVFYFVFLSSFSFSDLYSQGKDCRYLFVKTTDTQGGPFEIISSERDKDKLDTLSKFTQKAVEVATSLGYHVPPHHLNFVPSDKFAIFLSTSGYASPHWIDGSKIVNEYKSNAGVLEVVFPGNSTCRSFYKDTNGLCEQLSTILHVFGHNDVSDGNILSAIRRADSVAASKNLSDLMIKLYETNQEDVARFYQYLDVLTFLQDFVYGSYEPYTKFLVPKTNELEIFSDNNMVLYHDGLFTRSMEKPKMRIPSYPTLSVYQALSATYEKGPEWQKRMIRLSEERSRNFPFVFNTRFMNEGWATFSEYFLLKHMPAEYRTSDYLIQYAQLAFRVSYPRLDNPYWLGLEAWYRLYHKFLEQNIVGSDLERDQKFVKYAHDIIHNMTDSTFLTLGLDESWINKYHLVLSRKSTEEELEAKGVKPKQGKAYITVVSTDHKRIVKKIVRQVTAQKRLLPEISLVDLDYESSYVLYRHRVVDDIPLKFDQSIMALWVLSQLHKKAVGLDTIFNDVDNVANIRILVSPKGEVKVILLDSNTKVSKEDIAQLEKDLANYVAFYQLDLALTYDKVSENVSLENSILSNKLFQSRMTSYTNNLIKAVPPYVAIHTPAAWRAVNEYFKVVHKRVARQIAGMLAGKQKINISSTGVRVRALPILPQFALDHDFLEDKIANLPPAPLDHFLVARDDFSGRLSFLHNSDSSSKPSNIDSDDNTRVHSYPGDVGDIIEVDAVPSGEGEGSQGGNGEAMDPNFVEISLDEWGEILAQYLSLKNIKHTKGKNKALHSRRKGRLSMYREPLDFPETFNKALDYGIADYLLKKEDGAEVSLDDLNYESLTSVVENGIGIMPLEEMVHIPMRQFKKPDFDAVVVFAIDLSGSMQGELQEQAKRFVWSTVSFLRQKYRRVDIRYVGYDMQAREFSEKDIWNTYLGGGTKINQGFLKSEQIIDSYPSHWSKYIYNISDAGDFDPVSVVVDTIDHLRSKVQHFGFIHANLGSAWYDQSFIDTLSQVPNNVRNFGYTTITETPQSIIQALHDLFGERTSN